MTFTQKKQIIIHPSMCIHFVYYNYMFILLFSVVALIQKYGTCHIKILNLQKYNNGSLEWGVGGVIGAI